MHQPQEWAGPPDTGCVCAVMPVLGVGGRGMAMLALAGLSGLGSGKVWQLSSTSVKTSGILSGKSSGRRGTSTVAVGALGVPTGGLPDSSCSPFVPWKELMSRGMSLPV